MAKTITPFLMFGGAAEQAMNLYISVFPNSKIESIERYGPEGPGAEGSVKIATLKLNGQRLNCIDSPVNHDFSFTPSVSLFVECEDESELDRAFNQLSADGKILMELGDYGFSTKFGWFNDRFGVSWQLNLE